ncbi:hemicentin-2-like [Orbicella faveolata]|uniref:hemicentin-2-like n=1 Tax=Orbicella faveolata TaxID=48498 RepID=UPI0009E2EEF0|nr:hemicentin-2-like [Orbicella faveolata]
MSVVNGSTQVPLRWIYTLSSGLLTLTTFSVRLNDGSFDDIGTISGGNTLVFNKSEYPTRFDINGSEQATLIINKFTETEDKVYECKITTDSNQWSYRIRVIVTAYVDGIKQVIISSLSHKNWNVGCCVSAPLVTWIAPPPQWTQSDPNDIRTVDKPVVNGSTQVALRWNYTLSSGLLTLTTFSVRLSDGSFDDIGTISGSNTLIFNKREYPTRFEINGSEQATLIINKVMETEDEVYECKLTTDSNQWSYRIRVIVIDPAKIVASRHKREHEVAAQQRVSLDCPAEGNPKPTYTWTPCDPQQSVCHESTLIILEAVMDTNYSCTVENLLGSDTINTSLSTSITWTAPPSPWTQTDPNDIRRVDMSVVKGSTQVALRWNYTLSAGSNLLLTTFYIIDDGNSDDIGALSPNNIASVNDKNDYRTRFDISTSEVATLIINKVTEREEAVYQCRLTVVGNVWAYEIRVIVLVESSIPSDSGNQTIIEGSNVTLFCNASGKPGPNVTWTMENGNDGGEVSFENPWVIKNVSRNDIGTYRCTANNGVGNPVSRILYVNVTFPAKIVTSRHKRDLEVAAQQRVSLDCPAEGNPKPTYTWTPCDPQQSACHESTLFIPEVLKDMNYSCRVENFLGSDTANTSLCHNQPLRLATPSAVFSFELECVAVFLPRCGSVIVDLALKFNSTVRESEVLSILRDANKNGRFEDLHVSAIKGTRGTGITPTITTTPTSSSDSTTWIIVGVVLGVVAALAVAGGVVWYVRKKRKCKKRDPKEVHNNGSQGEAG